MYRNEPCASRCTPTLPSGILIHLGLRHGRRVQTEEIAAAWRISSNHLDKVVQRLAAAGLMETRRGRGGGMVLARAPEAIRLGEVVRCTEEDLALVACFAGDGDPCGDQVGDVACWPAPAGCNPPWGGRWRPFSACWTA